MHMQGGSMIFKRLLSFSCSLLLHIIVHIIVHINVHVNVHINVHVNVHINAHINVHNFISMFVSVPANRALQSNSASLLISLPVAVAVLVVFRK